MLLAMVMLVMMTGCGSQDAVHTSAEAQEEVNDESTQEEEAAEEAVQPEAEEEKSDAVVAQMELDEETKNDLVYGIGRCTGNVCEKALSY